MRRAVKRAIATESLGTTERLDELSIEMQTGFEEKRAGLKSWLETLATQK